MYFATVFPRRIQNHAREALEAGAPGLSDAAQRAWCIQHGARAVEERYWQPWQPYQDGGVDRQPAASPWEFVVYMVMVIHPRGTLRGV